jgi:uncharacterized damage-inducible protein DinB
MWLAKKSPSPRRFSGCCHHLLTQSVAGISLFRLPQRKGISVISIRKSLEHLAWSDDQIFRKLEDVPVEIYDFSLAIGERTIGELVRHIVGGAEWCRFLLTGKRWTELKVPASTEQLTALREHLILVNAAIFAEAAKEDELLSFDDGGDKDLRSTILAQAVLHSAEHKAQIVSTLKVHGFTSINLDNFDVWNFANLQ